jgi:hypothetical protein
VRFGRPREVRRSDVEQGVGLLADRVAHQAGEAVRRRTGVEGSLVGQRRCARCSSEEIRTPSGWKCARASRFSRVAAENGRGVSWSTRWTSSGTARRSAGGRGCARAPALCRIARTAIASAPRHWCRRRVVRSARPLGAGARSHPAQPAVVRLWPGSAARRRATSPGPARSVRSPCRLRPAEVSMTATAGSASWVHVPLTPRRRAGQ